MNFDEYQKLATRTSTVSNERSEEYALMYFCLGLAGETGEVIEKIKKVIRNHGGEISDEQCEGIKQEVGDVLWYLSQIARVCNISLNDAANGNIKKLADRTARGVIKSKGDTR